LLEETLKAATALVAAVNDDAASGLLRRETIILNTRLQQALDRESKLKRRSGD
jgi:hypothetical protein